MFSIGDIVMYTVYGICKVEDITKMLFNGKENQYYILVPLNETKTRLSVPVDNPITKARLHPLLSEGEINDIIHEIPFLEVFWIDRDNDRKLKFSEIIKSGDRRETLRVLKSIKAHIIEVREKGRKLHATDESAMKDAEKLLLDEFSYVLNIDRMQVSIMLQEELEK